MAEFDPDKYLDDLEAQSVRLVNLLRERQTGLFTWHQAVRETITEIERLYHGPKSRRRSRQQHQSNTHHTKPASR